MAFTGNGGVLQAGIYTSIGSVINVVANTNTPIPGGTKNFTEFGKPAFDNGDVAFRGSFSSGIYTNIGGSLNVVAGTNTPVPNSTGNFAGFLAPSLNNGSAALMLRKLKNSRQSSNYREL